MMNGIMIYETQWEEFSEIVSIQKDNCTNTLFIYNIYVYMHNAYERI